MARRTLLTPHFRADEFDCHNGVRVPAAAEGALRTLCIEWLEPMRLEFGTCYVLSGYRTPTYNAQIGGAKASYHCNYRTDVDARKGVAADVRFATGRADDWYRWAVALRAKRRRLGPAGRGGIGRYVRSGFVHLDTGPARVWEG